MMPGQIPDPPLAAGSLPGLGPLAGISATTLTDQLKLADLRQLGTMLGPLHLLGRLGKRPLAIKTEVGGAGLEEGAGENGRSPSWPFHSICPADGRGRGEEETEEGEKQGSSSTLPQ